MNCPCCGVHYSDPEEIERIELYEMCTRCDNQSTEENLYDEED